MNYRQCAEPPDTFVREQKLDFLIARSFFFQPRFNHFNPLSQIIKQFKQLVSLKGLRFGESGCH